MSKLKKIRDQIDAIDEKIQALITERAQLAKQVALGASIVTFVLSIPLYTGFDAGTGAMQFIESIPARETRNYIERVLANLWIYRSRLGQPSPTLDLLAAGQAPFYKSLDGKPEVVAQNARN